MSDLKTVDKDLDEILQTTDHSDQDSQVNPPNTNGTTAPTSEEDDMDFDDDDDDDDDNDSKSNHSTSNKKKKPKGDKKRRHHNVLERKRRYLIKDSFTELKETVPTLTSERASRTQILKKAAEFIQHIHKKNQDTQADIDELERKNLELEKKLRASGKSLEEEAPSIFIVVDKSKKQSNPNQKQ